jgi:RimJ/RimL family protein N-acetyltransferase
MQFSEGQEIFNFKTKSGNTAILRYPKLTDASEMTNYINILSAEDTFITFSGESISYDDEYNYLDDQIKRIARGDVVKIICEVNGKMAGICDIYRNITGRRRSYHLGVFGISVAKEFRGEGIGYELARCTIAEAKKNITGLKIVTLSVYGPNAIAKSLYEKIGFKEFGRLPKGVWYRNDYIDEISMYLEI